MSIVIKGRRPSDGSMTTQTVLPDFRPHLPVRDGVQVRDFEQGYVATDCAAVATFAAGVWAGVDFTKRVKEVALHWWEVQLYRIPSGPPVFHRIKFDGHLLPTDPTCHKGEFLSVLLLRAYHTEIPTSVTQGDSLERASSVIFGKLPVWDDSPNVIGYDKIKAGIASRNPITFCTDAHAGTVLGMNVQNVVTWNVWGQTELIPTDRFFRSGLYEVAMIEVLS